MWFLMTFQTSLVFFPTSFSFYFPSCLCLFHVFLQITCKLLLPSLLDSHQVISCICWWGKNTRLFGFWNISFIKHKTLDLLLKFNYKFWMRNESKTLTVLARVTWLLFKFVLKFTHKDSYLIILREVHNN